MEKNRAKGTTKAGAFYRLVPKCLEGPEPKEIKFKAGREDSNVKTVKWKNNEVGGQLDAYTITPSGQEEQAGYRVLFETGKLTIRPAEITVTAGGSKVYGEQDIVDSFLTWAESLGKVPIPPAPAN